MSSQAWKVLHWVGLWVAVIGLFVCLFSVKAEILELRREASTLRTNLAHVEGESLPWDVWVEWTNKFRANNPERWDVPDVPAKPYQR